MSCMESKMTLRVEIESLKGNTYEEAYPYFKAFLGEADDVDEWEGKVEYFSYDKSDNLIVPVLQHKDKRWGIDYILDYHYDGRSKVGKESYTLLEIDIIASKLSKTFSVNKDDIRLVSYEWYNGGDEPVSFGYKEGK